MKYKYIIIIIMNKSAMLKWAEELNPACLSGKAGQEDELLTNEIPQSKGQKWTIEEETQLLEELDKGLDNDSIAKIHKRTVGSITSRIGEIAYKMYIDNNSIEDISNKTKLDEIQILDIFERQQYKLRQKEEKKEEKEPIKKYNYVKKEEKKVEKESITKYKPIELITVNRNDLITINKNDVVSVDKNDYIKLQNDVINMKNEIVELKTSIKELIYMMKAVYEFEDA